MLTDVLHLLLLAGAALPCIAWAFVWIKTFKGNTVRRLIAHTLIFAALSAFIAYVILRIVFSGVDETYSASNKGALGILFLMIMAVFVPACLFAFFQTVSDLISRRKKKEQPAPDEEVRKYETLSI